MIKKNITPKNRVSIGNPNPKKDPITYVWNMIEFYQ